MLSLSLGAWKIKISDQGRMRVPLKRWELAVDGVAVSTQGDCWA